MISDIVVNFGLEFHLESYTRLRPAWEDLVMEGGSKEGEYDVYLTYNMGYIFDE